MIGFPLFCDLCLIQPVHQDVLDKEPTFAALVEECQRLKNSSDRDADQVNLQEKLDDIEKRWSALNEKDKERHEVLEKAVPVATEYQDLRNQMMPWLTEAESKVEDIKLLCEPDALQTEKEKIKVCDCSIFPYHHDPIIMIIE